MCFQSGLESSDANQTPELPQSSIVSNLPMNSLRILTRSLMFSLATMMELMRAMTVVRYVVRSAFSSSDTSRLKR